MYLNAFNALLVLGLLFVGAAGAEVFSREEAVRLALEHNPQISVARQEWKAVQARATQAKSSPNTKSTGTGNN